MPVYLLQQAENRAEYQEDLEKKKQELFEEIDSFHIEGKTQINKLKRYLVQCGIWTLAEMDYPLRKEYQKYLEGNITKRKCGRYLHIYDEVMQKYIYRQMKTLSGKRKYEWKYQNQIIFLKYYPDSEIAENYRTVRTQDILEWDFKQDCSEVLKKQIFYTLTHIVTDTTIQSAHRNKKIMALKILYLSCIQQGVKDIGMLELYQIEKFRCDFEKYGNASLLNHMSIVGNCRKDAFMQCKRIPWEATVWYLDRLHLGANRINPSSSMNSISFMEIHEKENREILQAYMKYELGVTGQAVSTICHRFTFICSFLEMLEQEQVSAVEATDKQVKEYAESLRKRGIQAKGFNERIYSIGHFYKFMEVRNYISKMPFRIEYFQQKEIRVHHNRSVEEKVYMEILEKLHLFPERLRCMFLHLWCLGLRASEVCTLKGNAYYQQNGDYWIQVYQVKMKNYKKIPIPKALYQIMQVYLKKYEIQPDDYIFQNKKGGACLYSTFRSQMLNACEENEIAGGEYIFRSHDYRHTVATLLFDSKVSIQSIRDYLGHTYEEMTRQYIDYMPKKIAQANEEFFEMQGSSLVSCLKERIEDD